MAEDRVREQSNAQLNKEGDYGLDMGYPESSLLETLRLSLHRLVIASSVLTTGFTFYGVVWLGKNENEKLKWAVPGTVLTALTTAHHLGTAFVPLAHLPRFIAWLDVSLTVLESVCYIAVVGYLIHLSTTGVSGLGVEWFPKFALLSLVGIWFLTLSILILLALKVAQLKSADGKPIREPGDPWWKYPAYVLFGRRMWEPSLPGESRWLSSLRGFLALVTVCALVAYGVNQAIIMPIGEMGMTPHRAYRAVGLPQSLIKKVTNSEMEFNILLIWARHRNTTTSLTGAVTATARWKQRDSEPFQLQPLVECSVENPTLSWLDPRAWDIAVVSCPPSPDQGKVPDAWWDFPNFDLSVNYTGLLGGSAAQSDRVSDSVRVYLGMTGDIDKVYLSTEPVSLFPGTNTLAVANLVLRQRLSPASLATLGFESQENYLIASVVQTLPNPLTSLASDPNIGSLGFTLQDAINELTILQDFRSKSVLSGLSALGGLSSFLSTMLAMLLGTSLGRAISRAKPNSPYGFLHNIKGLQRQMVEGCDKKYPALRDEIHRYEKERGVSAYLFDTLIDFDTLGYGRQRTSEAGPIEATGSPRGPNDKEEGSPDDPKTHSPALDEHREDPTP